LLEKGIAKIDPKRRVVLLILAFAAVYILWGSTYLAIKYVIETMPPLNCGLGRPDYFAKSGSDSRREERPN
jgi:hypothetical protein